MKTMLAVLCFLPALALALPQGPTVDPKEQKMLEDAVKKDPADGKSWLRLGIARQQAGQLDGAAAAYEKAIAAKAGLPFANYNLAAIYATRKQLDDAFAHLESAGKAGFAKLDDVASDPDLAALRSDPRWPATVAKMDGWVHPCKKAAINRQLDFWIGEWEVRSPQGAFQGMSSVQNIIEGCVVYENWTGNLGYTGKSFNFYNPLKKAWQQTWVDSMGQAVELTGGLKDGSMLYTGEVPQADGKMQLQRLTFTPLPEGKVRQFWETSDDGGKSWQVSFEGIYARKK